MSIRFAEHLNATDKQRLITYGDGEPPFPGWEWDDGLKTGAMHQWVPGPGAAVTHPMSPEVAAMSAGGPKTGGYTNAGLSGPIYVLTDTLGKIISIHRTRERADRDVALIRKASGVEVEITEHEVE